MLGKQTRLAGWAHPQLVPLLKYEKLSLFIDGTFKCCPKEFSQLLIFMIYDAGMIFLFSISFF
jgi:hypothetical protein